MSVIGRADDAGSGGARLVLERRGWRIVSVTLWRGDEPYALEDLVRRVEVIEDVGEGPTVRLELAIRTSILERADLRVAELEPADLDA